MKFRLLAELPPRLRSRGGEPVPVAIGIATTQQRGDFRMAIRPRTELPADAVDFLRRTAGEVDVRVTGEISPLTTHVSPGSSAVHRDGCVGTIGFFATRKRDRTIGFVSNNHVIAGEDQGQDGDEVMLPVLADSLSTEIVIGRLDGDYPRLAGTGKPRTVDCAFAALVDGIDYAWSTEGGLSPSALSAEAAAASGAHVVKIGGRTGRTCGHVTAFRLDDVLINFKSGLTPFRSQIEIESLDDNPFSGGGDSGSLIFTTDRRPLALLFARSAAGGSKNSGLTYANPIAAVVEALGVEFLT